MGEGERTESRNGVRGWERHWQSQATNVKVATGKGRWRMKKYRMGGTRTIRPVREDDECGGRLRVLHQDRHGRSLQPREYIAAPVAHAAGAVAGGEASPPPPVAKAGWAPDPSRGCHTASAAAGGVDREGPNGSPVCGALLGDTRVGGSFWYGGGLEIAPPTKLPPAQRLIGHPCGAHTREASTC